MRNTVQPLLPNVLLVGGDTALRKVDPESEIVKYLILCVHVYLHRSGSPHRIHRGLAYGHRAAPRDGLPNLRWPCAALFVL